MIWRRRGTIWRKKCECNQNKYQSFRWKLVSNMVSRLCPDHKPEFEQKIDLKSENFNQEIDGKPRTICFVPLVLVTELQKPHDASPCCTLARVPLSASSSAHTPVLISDRLLHLYKLATPQGHRHTPPPASPTSKLSTVSHGAQLRVSISSKPHPQSRIPNSPLILRPSALTELESLVRERHACIPYNASRTPLNLDR
jgi:hypothetical protein